MLEPPDAGGNTCLPGRGRTMKSVAAGWLLAGLITACLTGAAHAGRWEWGCIGTIGDKQIVFNRYHLIVAPAKPPLGKIRDLVFLEDLTKLSDGGDQYDATDVNSGLTAKLEFILGDDGKDKIAFTEKSSKRIYHRSAMVCGRDEDTDVSRKIYRYQRNGEPARDVTMQCIEYMLSTRGGRPCIDRP